MADNNENNNSFELEWQSLREEYQNMMSGDKEDVIYPTDEVEQEQQIDNGDMGFFFPTKPYEDDDDTSYGQVNYAEPVDEDEQEQLEEKIYKSKQNLEEFSERNKQFKTKKPKMDIGAIAKNGFSKMVSFTNDAVTKASRKSPKTSEWTEEKRQELSTIIVVGFCILAFFVGGLLLIKIPSFVGNVFEFIESRGTIESDGVVYIDEKTREYHFENCPHINEGMRYLILEETYAKDLGYKGCEYILNEK
jgi:hypothetical protein